MIRVHEREYEVQRGQDFMTQTVFNLSTVPVNILDKGIAIQKYRFMLVLFLMKMGGENTLKFQTSSVSV